MSSNLYTATGTYHTYISFRTTKYNYLKGYDDFWVSAIKEKRYKWNKLAEF
jgi:hypothetical protein